MSDSLPPPPPSFNAPPDYPAGAGDGQFRPVGTNGKATASLVCGIVGLAFFGIILGIVAIVLGSMAKKEIAQTGQGGRGQATAGVVLGVVDIVLGVIFVSIVMS